MNSSTYVNALRKTTSLFAAFASLACAVETRAELSDAQTRLQFRPSSNMNTAREWHTATILQDGNVLVAAGRGNTQFGETDSAEIYRAATGQWVTTGDLIHSRSRHSATLLNNGK